MYMIDTNQGQKRQEGRMPFWITIRWLPRHPSFIAVARVNVRGVCSLTAWDRPKQLLTRSVFQGPTSSWSFTHRVLRRIAVCFGATIDLPLTTDGDVYQLPWEDKGPGDMPDVSDLPSYERALYLMSTIKYHLDDLFQLYDEEEFLSHLHELYDDVHRKVGTSRLWYIQYLMVLALGEAFLSPSRRKDGNPGGCQYFTRAMSLLPNLTKVWDDPILAIEVLTAVALYLYSVDMRDSSSCYVGARWLWIAAQQAS